MTGIPTDAGSLPRIGGGDRLLAEAVGLILAEPGMALRLVDDHVPDDRGLCRGCTTPGYGTPHAHWPCTPYTLGATALQHSSKPGPG